jgi:nucleoside-diphosphate-sugar epimerase
MTLVAELRDLVPKKDNAHARRHSITHGRLDELYAIIESEEARATGRTTFRSPAKVGLPSSIPRGDTFVPTACIMPERFFDKNVGGTLNLLRAAQALSIKRMLYISSTEVYGEAPSPKCDEKTELNPVNTYAVSKAAADRLCHTYYLEHGVPVVIARIFNCYGPRETEPYVIPEIIAQLHRGPRVALGNIKAERDFTFVHDTANALISVLASDVPDGDVVNVGSDTSFSVEWLARKLAEIMGVNALEIVIDPARLRRKDIDWFRCDNRKLLKYTDWRPTVGIDEGLKMTVDWFRANGARWSWESFVDGTTIYR